MQPPLQAESVVCFGEILWDFLPGGAVPGGAPMNVAYHLKKLGLQPQVVTRVGKDELGAALISIMESNRIDVSFFQVDKQLATGTVKARIGENNEVHYEIVEPVAWDNIQWEDGLGSAMNEAHSLVFGSLASRNEASRNTLFRLLERARHKILDINLRPPHYNRAFVEQLLPEADLLKLNAAELELLSSWYGSYADDRERLQVLQDRFSIPAIVVTKGENGALFNNRGVISEHPGFQVTVADTVGSGDAFLAGLIFKLFEGVPTDDVLAFASALGALVASHTGACPQYEVPDINKLLVQTRVTPID